MYDPKVVSYEALLKVFWENHDPTQGMAQGNDKGTQYRSGIYTYSAEQQALAEKSKEIIDAPEFYFAEGYHQQYLAKNPNGYCGLGGTKVCLPTQELSDN